MSDTLVRCWVEDWTPLFEEPHLHKDGPMEIERAAFDRYLAAKKELLDAHTALMSKTGKYDDR